MSAWFEHLSPFVGAVVIVGGFVLATVLFAYLVGRLSRRELLREHNDLAGFIFAVVGVIYAVILGFVAIGVWERFAAAETRTYDEATQLVTLYRDAGAWDGGSALRRELRAYTRDVITRTWPDMESGIDSHVTDVAAERLAHDVIALEPHKPGQAEVHAQMLAAVAKTLGERDQRLGEDASGLNAIMWMVVFVGGFVTIAFSLLFGFKATSLQFLMTGSLALLIGLIIFLTMSLDYPYRGSIRVTPDAFTRSLATFDQIDATSR